MEKFNNMSRVIAKDGDYYLVTNDKKATLYDMSSLAAVVKSDGTYITNLYPIDFFTREDDNNWESINGYYGDYIKRKQQNVCMDCLLGFAIGDALGVPVEFLSRDQVRKLNIKEMVGKDSNIDFNSRWGQIIPSGSWSDDTSMIVAGMSSIINKNGKVDYNDIMKNYFDWWTKGKFTSLDFPFGLGNIVSKSLEKYSKGVSPLDCGGVDIRDNGNGSLMRILPFSLYCIKTEMSEEDTFKFICNASALTHNHEISKMGCFIYTEFLRGAYLTKNSKLAFEYIMQIDYSKYFSKETIMEYQHILTPKLLYMEDNKILERNGYVVTTLTTVLYSVLNTDNYEGSVLKAINMGYDTDTIGGITGSIAGVLYGKENIPKRWLDKLRKKDYLIQLSQQYELLLERLKKNVNLKMIKY